MLSQYESLCLLQIYLYVNNNSVFLSNRYNED